MFLSSGEINPFVPDPAGPLKDLAFWEAGLVTIVIGCHIIGKLPIVRSYQNLFVSGRSLFQEHAGRALSAKPLSVPIHASMQGGL